MTPAPAPLSDALPDEASARYEGWRVVGTCFVMAAFAWGLGFYGHSVYLAELQRIHGWPSSLISTATTGFYLFGALIVIFLSEAMRVAGARNCLLAGIACMAVSTMMLGLVTQPWQLYAVYGVMAFGWAGTSLGAINITLGLWFRRKRGMAISLALNGASCGGIIGVPLLVLGIGAFGFGTAVVAAGVLMLAVVVPLIFWSVGTPPQLEHSAAAANPPASLPAATSVSALSSAPSSMPSSAQLRAQALRDPAFLAITIAFACVLFAQVAFIVHLIAFLDPVIGREQAAIAVAIVTTMAVVGRVLFSIVIDRLNQRLASSLSFLAQAAALVIFISTNEVGWLYLASAMFGFSVGNVITLPALIIQQEFDSLSFGVLVSLVTAICQITYSFGPGAIGLLRDASGNYTVPFMVCIALQVSAAVMILLWRRPVILHS